MTTRIEVAGTAGGVGATTIAAILALRLAAHHVDRTGGELDARCGTDGPPLGAPYEVHDLGPHAHGRGADQLGRRGGIAIITTAATGAGLELGRRAVGELAVLADPGQAVILVPVEVFGRHRLAASIRSVARDFPRAAVISIPRDRALAAGGRVPFEYLSTPTLRRIGELVRHVDETAAYLAG